MAPGEMVDEVVATDRIEPLVQGLLAARAPQSRTGRHDVERPRGLELNASWGEDRHYWLVLGRGSVLELAEVINTASLEILSHGYRQLLRYMVFAYGEREGAQPSVFLVFNYRAGQWYPLVPAPRPGDFKRAEREVEGVFPVELERELQAKLAGALRIVNAPNDWFQFQNAPF